MAPGSNGNRCKGEKNKTMGLCLAGFSVVFSSLKADTKKEKREKDTDAGRVSFVLVLPLFGLCYNISSHLIQSYFLL